MGSWSPRECPQANSFACQRFGSRLASKGRGAWPKLHPNHPFSPDKGAWPWFPSYELGVEASFWGDEDETAEPVCESVEVDPIEAWAWV